MSGTIPSKDPYPRFPPLYLYNEKNVRMLQTYCILPIVRLSVHMANHKTYNKQKKNITLNSGVVLTYNLTKKKYQADEPSHPCHR
jgi:hypothetical protein